MMPVTAIQHSDALILLDAGTPYIVGRKRLKASWTYSSTNTPTVHVGFTVIFYTGSDPQDEAARVASAVDVGPNIRTVEVAIAPTVSMVVKAAVRARYAGGSVSEWTVLPGTVTVTPEVIAVTPTRVDVQGVTGALADGATEDLDLAISGKSIRVLRIATDVPAWVRLYTTAAYRTDDSGRPITSDPTPDTGIFGEVLTAPGNLELDLNPSFYGSNMDDPPAGIVYAAITNKSGGASPVQVTLTCVVEEN